MIYEIRMTISFLLQNYDRVGTIDTQRVKSTLIEYINAKSVCDAYLEAGKRKNDILVTLLKKMKKCTQLSISLDAVVAKPDITIKQIVSKSKLRILGIKTDKSKERIECILPNGLYLMLTKPALETLLESFD